jgi:hypothetical protein
MTDLEVFRRYLEQDIPFIEQTDEITEEMVAFLTKYPEGEVRKLFRPIPPKLHPKPPYSVLINCCECKTTNRMGISKTKLFEIVRGLRKNGSYLILCPPCQQIKSERDLQRIAQRPKEIVQNTTGEMLRMISPTCSWNSDIPFSDRLFHLQQAWDSCDKELVERKIKELDYSDFLKTPYWICISGTVRYRSKFKCQLCNSLSRLHVHHKTYEHHGLEILFFKEDLICLCADCHETFHQNRKVA